MVWEASEVSGGSAAETTTSITMTIVWNARLPLLPSTVHAHASPAEKKAKRMAKHFCTRSAMAMRNRCRCSNAGREKSLRLQGGVHMLSTAEPVNHSRR